MGQIYERNIHSFLKMTNIVCKPTYNSDELISVEVSFFCSFSLQHTQLQLLFVKICTHLSVHYQCLLQVL